jgi:hypothetical protein
MTRARAWRALLALIIVSAVGITVPTQASALVSFFSCSNKPNLEWCDGKANGTYDGQHSWDYIQGWHAAGGSFFVCQGIYRPATGGWLPGHSCDVDVVIFNYGNITCACYEAKVAQTSGSAQTLYGYADTE